MPSSQGQSIIESAAASAKSDTAGHINFLAGIIKHGSPTAPHFIGMQCKIEDIDTRAEPRLVEKNRRRARPRRFPPPIRPLCMDAATRRRVREIIALAEEFKLARRVDYTSWSEMQGTAHWFHLAEPV